MNDMAFAVRHTNNQVDEFLRGADEAYRRQVAAITETERAHSVRRAEIVAEYAAKMATVAAEGSEKLRSLDRQHEAVLNAEREKLDAIGRLRDS